MVFHGPGRQAEFELWQEAGVPVNEALRAATLNSHRLLNIEGGRLRPGARADLVLVKGDPLRDPLSLRQILTTYIGGQVVLQP
jgi:imidazolonepropionase-like amidohydrolase